MSVDSTLAELVRGAVRAELAPVLEALSERGPEPLLTTEGACKLLGCSAPTLRGLRREGLPCMMIGDSPRFEREALLAWLRDRGGK